MAERDVLITGIGLVSSLGVGVEAHRAVLSSAVPRPVVDAERFAPYTIHPLPEIDWSAQIAKRGDQRQMETWQRLGTYAAGLALDDAAIKDDQELCASMDMVVAAGGGERDEAVDGSILEAAQTRNDRGVLLNEKLTTELRPTLFLAQLSNLLAGNISIVHKVTGSSRTFMGEEGAGVAAVETAAARIRSGQSSHMLVGGAFQTEHPDMLLAYELGGYLNHGAWKPLWQREGDHGGLIPGSGAAFLVLESAEHAAARGRKPYAILDEVRSGFARRRREPLAESFAALLGTLNHPADPFLAISGASGAVEATSAERTALSQVAAARVRAFAGLTGHLKEAQFPFAIALAALALSDRIAVAPFDADNERPIDAIGDRALATCVGYAHFEGAATLRRG